jgi:hypothetical protein
MVYKTVFLKVVLKADVLVLKTAAMRDSYLAATLVF